MLALVGQRASEFNGINVATALHRLSKHQNVSTKRFQDGDAFKSLIARMVELLPLPHSGFTGVDARGTSTIAHALAALGVRELPVVEALVAAIKRNLSGFDRQGLATVAWALAKMPKVEGMLQLVRDIAVVALDFVESFLPQELSFFAWSLSVHGVKNNRLMTKIAELVRQQIASFTPQGLATVAAAFSKLGIFNEPLLVEIGAAARGCVDTLNGRDTVQLLWAFAKFKLHDEELFKALCKRADSIDFERQDEEFVVSFLWSLSTLHWTPDKGDLVARLLGRSVTLSPDFSMHSSIRLLTAITKLGGGAEDPSGARGLRGSASGHLDLLGTQLAKTLGDGTGRMGPQEVGIAAWALSTLQPKGWKKVVQAFLSRAESVLEDLNWWSVAHLEYAAWRLGDSELPLLNQLTHRCAAETSRLHAESDAFERDPAEALVAAKPWERKGVFGDKVKPRILVFGPGRFVRRALRDWGADVVPWRRFAQGRVAGVATSPWAPEGPFDGCVLRFPDSAEALQLALHGVASVLAPGAVLWVYGDVREGVLSTTRHFGKLFTLQRSMREQGDSRMFEAVRLKADAKSPLDAWVKTADIDLGDGPREWICFPSLFAGGVLDVMTKWLLEKLAITASDSPEWCEGKARVLDFACGTGALAAGFQRIRPAAKLTILDADTVALEAAQRNLPKAKAVVGDGLGSLVDGEFESCFDMIVSNPPVHRGHPDDLRVAMALLVEAPRLLREGGELWLVAQEHVPIGRLFALTAEEGGRCFANIEMMPTDDGRFVVWRALKGKPGSARAPTVPQRTTSAKADPTAEKSSKQRKKKKIKTEVAPVLPVANPHETPSKAGKKKKKTKKKATDASQATLPQEPAAGDSEKSSKVKTKRSRTEPTEGGVEVPAKRRKKKKKKQTVEAASEVD